MTDENNRKAPPSVEVVNPRYKGATPEMVARALLQRPKPKQDDEDDKDKA